MKSKYLNLKEHCTGSIGFFALSESEAGSDVAALSTSAKKKKGGDGVFVLNETKAWVTSAEEGSGHRVCDDEQGTGPQWHHCVLHSDLPVWPHG